MSLHRKIKIYKLHYFNEMYIRFVYSCVCGMYRAHARMCVPMCDVCIYNSNLNMINAKNNVLPY